MNFMACDSILLYYAARRIQRGGGIINKIKIRVPLYMESLIYCFYIRMLLCTYCSLCGLAAFIKNRLINIYMYTRLRMYWPGHDSALIFLTFVMDHDQRKNEQKILLIIFVESDK